MYVSHDSSHDLLQEPVDTEYVVMECIVMEGGDDVTLDPGDIVRLVSVESGGVLRVRTTEDPPSEGKILASYLRKKDSVKGLKMEGSSKYLTKVYFGPCYFGSYYRFSKFGI